MKNNPATQAYFARLGEASNRALLQAGRNEYRMELAGQSIALQFAGPALEYAFLPALRHLVVQSEREPDLRVTLWDSTSSGVELPEFPWHFQPEEPWKLIEEDNLSFFVPERKALLWLNRPQKQAIYWISNPAGAWSEEICHPLKNLWAWWFERLAGQLIHAGAVAGKRGAAILVGRGGSGKSTTCLLALNSPLSYLADDYCLVRLQPEPMVYSLYASGKILMADRPRFPWLDEMYIGENIGKAQYIIYPQLASRLVNQLPLTALIVPSITGQSRTHLEPARPMETLRALAPSTLLQTYVGSDSARGLGMLSELVRQLPCYRLLLGRDIENIPAVLTDFLDG